MLDIKIAEKDDFQRVRNFYSTLIDNIGDYNFSFGWKKDIYPSQEFLLDSINNYELYYGELENQIISSMIVNNKYNKEYNDVKWLTDASDDELLVIHTLGVDPRFAGKGFAKEMVHSVIDMGRKKGLKSIRLDVLEGNTPAEKSYTKIGFQYRSTMQMYYEDTGYTNYRLFEYIL